MKVQRLLSVALVPIAGSYAQSPIVPVVSPTGTSSLEPGPTASPLPPVSSTVAAFVGELSTAILYASLIGNDNDLGSLCRAIDPPALSNITGIDGVTVQREVCAAATLSRNATIRAALVPANQKGVSYLATALFAVQVAGKYAGGTDLTRLCSEIETELVNNLFMNYIDNFGTTIKNYICTAAAQAASSSRTPNPTSTPSSNTTGTCASPTGFANRIVPVPDSIASTHFGPTDAFNTAHELFIFTDLNIDIPEAIFTTVCLEKCFGVAGCVSIFVNLGRPYPAPASGNDTAPRWYCAGYDVPLSADAYGVYDAPESYLYGLGVNRVCEGTFRGY